MEREPISETNRPILTSRVSACQHEYEMEDTQFDETLTSYVCRKCGHGLMIGEDDSISNYPK